MRMIDVRRRIQSGLTRSAALTLAVGAGGVALALQAGVPQGESPVASGTWRIADRDAHRARVRSDPSFELDSDPHRRRHLCLWRRHRFLRRARMPRRLRPPR
jgi:hypothetical protein